MEARLSTQAARLAVSASEPEIWAAGGLVRRRVRRGLLPRTELALVHRPRYDDWSFPKGKRDGEESDEETALREVEEETGLRCQLGADLGEVRYRDSKGRTKVVRYWAMDPVENVISPFAPNREVDDLRWCTATEADKLLSYEHDRVLLERLKGRA